MKLSPSFVLALAAASSASASPLLRRQTATSSSSAASSSSSGVSSSSMSGSAPASMPTGAAGGSNSTTGGSNSTSSGSSGSTTTFNDTQILQYALTLEHLEATFYNQSLSKLSTSDFQNAGYNSSVRDQIYSIGRDEADHVAFLSTALGNNSIPACTYDFSSVTDVDSFLATARVLEGVGVSAYLGAAQNITNKAYLEAAGSILTVESRHASYIISQTDDGGNAIPSPFDTPLDFKEVYSLAAPFIKSCPSNASLPITAFPSLNLTGGASNGSFTPGQQVTVSYSNSSSSNSSSSSGNKYLAIIQGVSGPQFLSLSGNNASVTLPSNLTGGQMYAVVTSSNTAVTDDNTLAGPAVGFVNIPLPSAPEATNSSSSSSSASSSSASMTASTSVAGGPGAGPTGSMSSMSAPSMSGSASMSMPTGSGSMSGPAAPTGSMSVMPSVVSKGSANLPQPSASSSA